MSEYAVEKREISTEELSLLVIFQQYRKPGAANAAIKEYAPVMIDAANDNKIIPVATTGSEAKRNRYCCCGSRKRRTSDILHDG